VRHQLRHIQGSRRVRDTLLLLLLLLLCLQLLQPMHQVLAVCQRCERQQHCVACVALAVLRWRQLLVLLAERPVGSQLAVLLKACGALTSVLRVPVRACWLLGVEAAGRCC
jgi:hypothetical protein